MIWVNGESVTNSHQDVIHVLAAWWRWESAAVAGP